MEPLFTARDREQLTAAGIEEAEARRQFDLLSAPRRPTRLERPCTVGDGILRLSPEREADLAGRGAQAVAEGRVSRFVPASGAATRMFASVVAARERGLTRSRAALEAAARDGDVAAADLLRVLELMPQLALARPLAARFGGPVERLIELAGGHGLAALIDTLLDESGLGAAHLPKALLPFHLDGDRAVTAFEEQIVEAASYLTDDEGRCRLHFTIPPGEIDRFQAALADCRERLEPGVHLEATFSEQQRRTDTICLDEAGRPARDADGGLILRPSGHGALLPNLAATGGDLVTIKNIDNVLPRPRHGEVAHWKRVLIGLAVEQLEGDPASAAVRPMRICGVVRNAGEPGGGPFWVAGDDGPATPQIVEASQVDLSDPAQAAAWAGATHFNPVDLVVALRRPDGTPHELERFVDAQASIVSTKPVAGGVLRVLERPGLWNGSMAGWSTLFVEVPATTFAPVKTVLDLARPEHAEVG